MSGATVLVVDDDPGIRQLLQMSLETEGYLVLTANDGADGLERARTARPDLMVVDVMMPKMNGLDVARTLKADPETATIPIILLSARAQAGDLRAGTATGADDYVTKPFDPLDLLDRVSRLLHPLG